MAKTSYVETLQGTLDEQTTRLEEAIGAISQLDDARTSLTLENERLQESLRETTLFLEDYNWVPIEGWEENVGFTLETVKKQADRGRSLLAINPTVKKAVNARVGYIWGRGLQFKGTSVKKVTDIERNQDNIFSETAQWEIEAALATDGNLFVAKHTTSEETILVPLDQISGYVSDENDPSKVTYWLRTFTTKTKNFASGTESTKTYRKFIPAYGVTNPVGSIEGIPVERAYRMIHVAANRQKGWVLGISDITAVMFWSKAHKELFESGTTFVKAQGRYAAKVTTATRAGAQSAGSRIAEAPSRDPLSGEVLDVGGTAVMSGGMDMSLMGKMTGGVDFSSFDPVGALIAVGLGIPLKVLLGTADTEDTVLPEDVVAEMKLRQKLWSAFYKKVFGTRKVEVVWPKIKQETTYRTIQALEISNKSVTLTREELRALTLDAYGIDGDAAAEVDIEENSYYLVQKLLADNQADHAAEAAADAAATTPEQGVDAGVGKLSDGKDRNAARDNGEVESSKK